MSDFEDSVMQSLDYTREKIKLVYQKRNKIWVKLDLINFVTGFTFTILRSIFLNVNREVKAVFDESEIKLATPTELFLHQYIS